MERWIGGLLALTLPIAAHAQPVFPWRDVATFTELCTASPIDKACLSFVAGMIGTYHSLVDLGEIAHPLICLPDTLTEQEAIKRLLAFIAEHPEQRQFTVSDVFMRAMFQSFPCK